MKKINLEVKLLEVDCNPERIAVAAYSPIEEAFYIFPLEVKYFLPEAAAHDKIIHLINKIPYDFDLLYRSELIDYLNDLTIE